MRLRSSSTSPPLSPATSLQQMQQSAAMISPEVALELRIRYLEALTKGVNIHDADMDDEQKRVREPTKVTEINLVRRIEDLQKRLDEFVERNETLKMFMRYYDRSSRYLSPAFALNDPAAEIPTATMTVTEFDTFLKDIEPELKQADKDLREIEILEKRGVTGAGELGKHEELQPRLDALLQAHSEDAIEATKLEQRITKLLQDYTSRTDTLSELFVEWNSAISLMEDQMIRLEKDRAEQTRLGFE